MAKSLFEELGGKYERQGDYLIPCLTVPAEEEQAIGIWGQRHLDYLKQYRKVMLWSSIFVTLVAKKYLVPAMSPSLHVEWHNHYNYVGAHNCIQHM
uniref:TnpV protein n=1 Tax=Roseburia hominis TaxID=301301 RepID=UPI001F190BE1